MTIALGFWCVDGIMLCADTQETHANYIKLKQPKLEIKGQELHPHSVFAGATEDGDFADALVDKLWFAMDRVGNRGLDAMIEAAEDELIKQYQRLVPSYPSEAVPETSMLVGVWAGSGPEDYELIKIHGPVLKRKVFLESIGCGDILAKYITARFIRPKTWLALSVPVGLYVIDQAKQYVEGCGGDTQLVAMYSTGHIETYTGQQAQKETERLIKIDSELRHIFGRLTDRYNSIDQFRTLFAEDLKHLEELVTVEPSGSEK